jgi:hypothetical protein
MKFSLKSAALILAVSCCPALLVSAANDQSRGKLEKELRNLMVGRAATLRTFYTANELRFDSDGKLVGESKTGSWTYYARISVESVKLGETELVISGNRNVSEWQGTEFRNKTLQRPMRITIALPAGYDEAAVTRLLYMVFLDRQTRLSDVTPDYWKEVLTNERYRREEWEQRKVALEKSVAALNAQTTTPKLLSKPEGVQVSATPFPAPDDNNTLLLWFVVDREGNVGELQIQRPIGLGVDDPIAETIKKWKFEPGSKAAQPVAVMMYARFVYKPRPDGQSDPSRNLPCKDFRAVFTC